jgi:hypothetical protein
LVGLCLLVGNRFRIVIVKLQSAGWCQQRAEKGGDFEGRISTFSEIPGLGYVFCFLVENRFGIVDEKLLCVDLSLVQHKHKQSCVGEKRFNLCEFLWRTEVTVLACIKITSNQ